MAYNSINFEKRVRLIIAVYNEAKDADTPDTKIVRTVFPKHGIFISYRTWMDYKGRVFGKPTDQLSLF